jgi:hypothetical protein
MEFTVGIRWPTVEALPIFRRFWSETRVLVRHFPDKSIGSQMIATVPDEIPTLLAFPTIQSPLKADGLMHG